MLSSFRATGRNTPLIRHLPNSTRRPSRIRHTAGCRPPAWPGGATRSPPLELFRRAHPPARAAGGEARSIPRATGPAPRPLAEGNCTSTPPPLHVRPTHCTGEIRHHVLSSTHGEGPQTGHRQIHRSLCSTSPGPNKATGCEVRTAGKRSRGTADPRGVAVQPLHEPTPPSTHGVRLHHELTPAGHDRHGVAGGRPRPRHLATAGESPSEFTPRGGPAGRGLPGRRQMHG